MPRPRIILPSPGAIAAAQREDIASLDATQIALLFELHESDINFDGLYIPGYWLETDSGLGGSEAKKMAQAIDECISRDYPLGMRAGVRIEGIAEAADVVRWLRALRVRSYRGPSRHTRLALIKD